MTIQAGSYGFRLGFQVQADLAGTSALRVDIRRPDGTLLRRENGDVSVDDAAAGALSIEVRQGDLDQAGTYAFQVWDMTPGRCIGSGVDTFEVLESL